MTCHASPKRIWQIVTNRDKALQTVTRRYKAFLSVFKRFLSDLKLENALKRLVTLCHDLSSREKISTAKKKFCHAYDNIYFYQYRANALRETL
jgi:lipoate-protein ligase A